MESTLGLVVGWGWVGVVYSFWEYSYVLNICLRSCCFQGCRDDVTNMRLYTYISIDITRDGVNHVQGRVRRYVCTEKLER
jgi:hypothetical protein